MGFVERVWFESGLPAAATRAALWPLARAYGAAMSARASLYDAGMLSTERPVLPTVSVGNLTVGGTGKTPFAAWLVSQLRRSARPAIALRGYGEDEIEVHRRLNPEVPVVANVDRGAAVRDAKARGADVVVLDDAFQHRRIARIADVVLLSAEQLLRPRRLLPAGPWREPVSAASRADLVVVSRKSASAPEVASLVTTLRDVLPGVAIATIHLAPHALASLAGSGTIALDRIRGSSVTAIAAIGEPHVFARQLEQLGARVSLEAFRDHHEYSIEEIRILAARVPADGFAVCTLKDAVKLLDRWPGPSRLWYVSQQLVVEQGAEEIDSLLKRVLDARASIAITAG